MNRREFISSIAAVPAAALCVVAQEDPNVFSEKHIRVNKYGMRYLSVPISDDDRVDFCLEGEPWPDGFPPPPPGTVIYGQLGDRMPIKMFAPRHLGMYRLKDGVYHPIQWEEWSKA